MNQGLTLTIPTQILDVFGVALVLAAKNGAAQDTATFMQAWAWLNSETQKASAAEQQQSAEQAEKQIKARIEAAVAEAAQKASQDKASPEQKRLAVEK